MQGFRFVYLKQEQNNTDKESVIFLHTLSQTKSIGRVDAIKQIKLKEFEVLMQLWQHKEQIAYSNFLLCFQMQVASYVLVSQTKKDKKV